MAGEKKAYPLRISAEVIDALNRWAEDDLRSMNAQIEYVLRDALSRNGRAPVVVTPKKKAHPYR